MNRETIFSPCRKWRYTLWREWDVDSVTGCSDDLNHAHQYVQFIGLNPSTADEVQDDPTIRRCIQFAKDWGYGALCMTNLFAWRATEPEDMMRATHPIGDDNDKHLAQIAAGAGVIIAAWGNDGSYLYRAQHVKKFIPAMMCLKMTGNRQPAHPLYLKGDLKPIPLITT